MNLLIVTPYIPFPLSEGGRISQYAVIDRLRINNRIILVLACAGDSDEKNITELKQHWPDVDIRAIVIKEKQPISYKQKIKRKIISVWSAVRKIQTNILKENRVVKKATYETDKPFLINISKVKSRKFIEGVATIIADSNPDVVQIDFVDYIELALVIPHGMKKVFVHHELRFARLLSSLKTGNGAISPYDYYALELAKQQEMMFLKLYDGIFVFSEDDKQKLKDELPTANIFVAPFPVLDKYFMPITEQNAVIDKLIFVGGEEHAPNKDAVDWYLNEIAAEVHKVRNLVLHVIGKWSTDSIAKYQNNSFVHFAGYVDELVSYSQNSIMIVPVRIGSGIRTKILYAMAQGVPVISASIGCEGIRVKDEEGILVANTAAEFAHAIKKILNNTSFTLRLVHAAQDMTKKWYSQQYATSLRMECFDEILRS